VGDKESKQFPASLINLPNDNIQWLIDREAAGI